MESTISVQEKAPPMCSADTFCEMSRMRRRYFLQRALAARTSKMFARLAMGASLALVDDGPIVVASVARLLEQLDPAVRIVVELGGQPPVLEHRLLLGRAVAVDLHEGMPARHAFNLAQRLDAPVPVEIVDGIERNHRLEAVVRERQLERVAEVEPSDHLGLGVHQRVFRDVEAERLEPGHGLHEILDQESLARADVEHAVAGPETEMRDHVRGDRHPAPVIAVAAVAIFARPVEVHLAVLARDADVLLGLGVLTGGDIALALGELGEEIEFSHFLLRDGASGTVPRCALPRGAERLPMYPRQSIGERLEVKVGK